MSAGALKCHRETLARARNLSHDSVVAADTRIVDAAQLPAPQLGRILIAARLLTEEQLAEALEEQSQTGRRLGEIIVQRGFISGPALANALAEQHGGVLKTEYGFASGLGGDAARRAASEASGGIPVPQLRPPDPAPIAQLRTVDADPAPATPEPEDEQTAAEKPSEQEPVQEQQPQPPAPSLVPPVRADQPDPAQPFPLLRTAETAEPIVEAPPPPAPLEASEPVGQPEPVHELSALSTPEPDSDPGPAAPEPEVEQPVAEQPLEPEPVDEQQPPARSVVPAAPEPTRPEQPDPAPPVPLLRTAETAEPIVEAPPTPAPSEASEPAGQPEPIYELSAPSTPGPDRVSTPVPALSVPSEPTYQVASQPLEETPPGPPEPAPSEEAPEPEPEPELEQEPELKPKPTPEPEPEPAASVGDGRESLIESLQARLDAQEQELVTLREQLAQERARGEVQVHVWPEEQAAAAAPPPAEKEHFLLCVPTSAGYVLLDRIGPLPTVGQAVDVPDEEGRFLVTKIVRLPRNGRPCAYLQRA